MKKHLIILLLTALSSTYSFAISEEVWKEINPNAVPTKGTKLLTPVKYKVFQLNDNWFKGYLADIPLQSEKAKQVMLAAPDGSMHNFRVWQTPVMQPELAAKYPEIKNFTGVSTDNPAITVKLNYTYRGFNAMVYDGNNTYFIDPYSHANDGFYICYYKKDYPASYHSFSCGVADDDIEHAGKMIIGNGIPRSVHKTNGTSRKTFRLALTCTGEYAQAVDGSNPVKANVISKMTNTITRVNGILEKELNITLQLINNNDQLVYLDPASDPFTAAENNVINSNTQAANQANTTSVIGTLNYDIGHVFCSGNGGIADLDGLCDVGHEARAATGNPNPEGDAFDVDYVAHEVGHQLGAEHTFNYNGSGCNPHANSNTAYEPGSGSTIMAYAGLCSGNDIQFNSDDYFHAVSLEQMKTYIASTNSLTCGTTTTSNNTPPAVADIKATYNIPHKTPFELEAPLASDNDHDVLTYCWEQYDLGDFGQGLINTQYGPILRSFKPTTSRWRVFPIMDSIRNNTLEYPGEKLPQVTRSLNFRLTVRDVLNGEGTYNWSDNTLTLEATDQAGPFVVLGPNKHTDYWRNGNSYTITWDVANTTAAPVSCANVDIYLSYDDGITWPVVLASNTPNDGSETVAVPANSYTSSARVKVKGANNVFFDISNEGFSINDWPDSVNDIELASNIKIFPIPAHNSVHIQLINGGYYNTRMTNAVGQTVWTGEVDGTTTINVSNMSAGVYHLTFTSKVTGNRFVKKLVVE